MQVNAYLVFDGRCDEAMAFYRDRLGAKIKAVMRFKEMPPSANTQNMHQIDPEKVMHAEFWLGETMVMASDGHCQGKPRFEGVQLSLAVDTEADADRCFNALADGGQVRMPLAKTFYSPRFGMVTDRFGVAWIVIVPGAPPNQRPV